MNTKVLLFLLLAFSLNGQYDANKAKWFTNLDEALREPDRVYQLDLSGQGLKEVPPQIRLFTRLEALVLSNNNIHELGEALNGLKNLEAVELNHNQIRKIDFDVFRASAGRLEELYIRGNKLGEIDGSLDGFLRMDILDLGSNKILRIDPSIQLPQLKWLLLDANALTVIPAFANNAHKLKSLNLNGNKILRFEYRDSWSRLERLDIGDNPIRNLLLTGNMKNLKVLILDWIKLQEESLAEIPDQLETLSMEHCELKAFPNRVFQLSKLKQLSIMHNEIDELSIDLSLFPKMEKLWIGGNPLNIDSRIWARSNENLVILDH